MKEFKALFDTNGTQEDLDVPTGLSVKASAYAKVERDAEAQRERQIADLQRQADNLLARIDKKTIEDPFQNGSLIVLTSEQSRYYYDLDNRERMVLLPAFTVLYKDEEGVWVNGAMINTWAQIRSLLLNQSWKTRALVTNYTLIPEGDTVVLPGTPKRSTTPRKATAAKRTAKKTASPARRAAGKKAAATRKANAAKNATA